MELSLGLMFLPVI